MNIDLAALRALAREREIPDEFILGAIETALLTAYRHTGSGHAHARVRVSLRLARRTADRMRCSKCSGGGNARALVRRAARHVGVGQPSAQEAAIGRTIPVAS